MLDLQQEFIGKNIPGYIGMHHAIILFAFYLAFYARDSIKYFVFSNHFPDFGYHYTDPKNMNNIRTHGLMTLSDRTKSKVTATPRGRYDPISMLLNALLICIDLVSRLTSTPTSYILVQCLWGWCLHSQ